MNLAPVLATTPDGTRLAPVRALVVDDTLTIEDRDGTVLATATVTAVSGGRRITTVDTTGGRWVLRSLCSCSSSQRALLRQWEVGDSHPPKVGT